MNYWNCAIALLILSLFLFCESCRPYGPREKLQLPHGVFGMA